MANILQLKISLDGINPPIWRRFLIKNNDTFEQLHKVVQNIMGWGNYHMYEFKVGNFVFTGKGDVFCVDSMWEGSRGKEVNPKKAKLNEYLKEENFKFKYTYDFGDRWMHHILIEKILPDDSQKCPFCIGGKRACPPEDCGGVPGYYDLMEIRKNKKHEQYTEMIVDWLGEDYDPEEFDAKEVNVGLGNHRRVLSELDMVKKAIALEFKQEFDNALIVIYDILRESPNSYSGYFLKGRIERKKGGKDTDSLKSALELGIKMGAGHELFSVMGEELEYCGVEKNELIINNFLSLFKEKKEENIEIAFGFDHYLELKDRLVLGKNQNHKNVVNAFIEFAGTGKLIVIKEDDGTVKELFEMSVEEIKENLLLLEKHKGIFYDDILEISYSFLSKNSLGCVHSNMLFFSANEENTLKMAKILDKYGLIYFEPEKINEFER